MFILSLNTQFLSKNLISFSASKKKLIDNYFDIRRYSENCITLTHRSPYVNWIRSVNYETVWTRGFFPFLDLKINEKRTVIVRRVIIFWNISRHPLLIWFTLLSSSVQNCEGDGTATADIVVLTPAKNLNKVFWGLLVVSPLFNHFLGYV